MGTQRRSFTGEIAAKPPSAVPRGSKRRAAERMGPEKPRVLPEAGADDNSAWGQKKRDIQGMRKKQDERAQRQKRPDRFRTPESRSGS